MSVAAILMARHLFRLAKEEEMSRRLRPLGLSLVLVLLGTAAGYAAPQESAQSAPAETQEQQLPSVDWKVGPTQADIGRVAAIKVPEKHRFTGAVGTRQLMERMGNPTSGQELGLLAPDEDDWFVVFEFSDSGHVKDNEKDKLDADAILKAIREGNEASNEERKRRGWATIDVVGWSVPPRYDEATHNLEWAVLGRSGDHDIVNYNTRLLGRVGVMEANLVVAPEQLQATLPQFKQLLAGYSFQSGHRYEEFKPGDKVAEYGLAALVAGGAAAVALKTGWLAKFWKVAWKLIIFVVAGVGAMFKKVFGGRKSPGSTPTAQG
jgi:uncharacterized membrane-anchored protein